MKKDETMRSHVLYLIQGGGAHIGFEAAVGNFPVDLRGKKVPPIPYTAWDLLEHMRIAQWDILEFSRNPEHVSPEFPDGYWPGEHAPPDKGAWDKSIEAFSADLKAMQELVSDPASDLLAPLPYGKGQTLLREALLVADHNAYHLGQMVVVRRILGCWQE